MGLRQTIPYHPRAKYMQLTSCTVTFGMSLHRRKIVLTCGREELDRGRVPHSWERFSYGSLTARKRRAALGNFGWPRLPRVKTRHIVCHSLRMLHAKAVNAVKSHSGL